MSSKDDLLGEAEIHLGCFAQAAPGRAQRVSRKYAIHEPNNKGKE
jgi:hypothetical protein